MGAARQPDRLRGRHRRLRAGDRPLPPSTGAAHSPPDAPTATAVAPPPIPPTGFAVEAAPPGDLGAALVGRTVLLVLYWWPDDCWQRGTPSPASARAAPSRTWWPRRRPRRRVWRGPFGLGPSNPKFEFGRGWSQLPCLVTGRVATTTIRTNPRAGVVAAEAAAEEEVAVTNGHSHRIFC